MRYLLFAVFLLTAPLAALACEDCLKQQLLDKIEELRLLAEQLPAPPIDPEEPEDPPHDEDLGDFHIEHIPDFTEDINAIVLEPTMTLEVSEPITVSTLLVKHGATLILNPGADIVFLDVPFHDDDASQIGNGLIVMGNLRLNGTSKTPFARAAEGIPAGADSFVCQAPPENWQAGDILALPDTRQRIHGAAMSSWAERVTVTAVSGSRVQITPTQYDHPTGTHEWMTPHVANLTRDVVIRSENPGGIRGHSIFMGGAKVTGGYAEIRDFGRTDATRLHNSTVVVDGVVTHRGTNENGRYPWHWHMMRDHGQGSEVEGLVINGSRKWCMTIHGTNHVKVTGCVGIGAVGATFITEDGTERGNVFRGNLAMTATSGFRPSIANTNTAQDFARESSGFWSRSVGNSFIDNIAANVLSQAFVVNGERLLDKFRSPMARDAGIFDGNEAYATGSAVWIREQGGGTDNARQSRYARLHINNCRGWNLHHAGLFVYRTTSVSSDNCQWYADPSSSSRNVGEPIPHSQNRRFRGLNTGFSFTEGYQISSVVVRNSTCEGFNIGVFLPPTQFTDLLGRQPIGFLMEDCEISASVHVVVPIVRNNAPYRLNRIAFLASDVKAVSPIPPDTSIWMNLGGKIVEWPRFANHDIVINGSKYYYPDEVGEGRVEVDGVIGLVEPQE